MLLISPSGRNAILSELFLEIIDLLGHVIFKTPKEKRRNNDARASGEFRKKIGKSSNNPGLSDIAERNKVTGGVFVFRMNASATKLRTKSIDVKQFYGPLPTILKDRDFFLTAIRISQTKDKFEIDE